MNTDLCMNVWNGVVLTMNDWQFIKKMIDPDTWHDDVYLIPVSEENGEYYQKGPAINI